MSGLRVALLVPELGRSGGIATTVALAGGLRERGFECELLVCSPKAAEPPPERDGVPVRRLAAARGERFDAACSTWWATAESLWELDARRRLALLLNVEHRFYRDHELADLAGAARVLAKPLDFVPIASFMEALLAELRPDARVFPLRLGIDKRAFAPRPRPAREGPLRVLVEGQPTLWFKGVADALAAVRGMSEPATVTVAVHDPAAGEGLEADRVVSVRAPEEMAALYAEHDVQLKLPRFEGLGLPPLEGFHLGLPCVTTPFTAHEDYMEHGANGLVVGFDDLEATSAALDLLARDPALLARLSEGALATAAAWPDAERTLDDFAGIVERALGEEPPATDLRHLERMERLHTELARDRLDRLAGLVAWREEELADTRQTLFSLAEEFRVATSSRAYRTGIALRRLAFWRRSR